MIGVVEPRPLGRSLGRAAALVAIGPADDVALAGLAITTAATSATAPAPPSPPPRRIGRVVARGLAPATVVLARLTLGPGRLRGGIPAEIVLVVVERVAGSVGIAAAVGRRRTRAGHSLATVVLPTFPTAPAAAATPPPPTPPFARFVVPRSAGLAVDMVALPAACGLVAGRFGTACSTWRRGTRRFHGLSHRCRSLTAGRPRGEREFVVLAVAIGFPAGLTVATPAVRGRGLDAGRRLTGRRSRFGGGLEAE